MPKKKAAVIDLREEIKKRRAAPLSAPRTMRGGKPDLKQENPVIVSDIISITENRALAKKSQLISVNERGLAFKMGADQILMPRQAVLKTFLNHQVELFLSNYELPMEGVVKDVTLSGENVFEIFIGFADSVSPFYKACVADLLAIPGGPRAFF